MKLIEKTVIQLMLALMAIGAFAAPDVCPLVTPTPEQSVLEQSDPELVQFEDKDKEVKDKGTDFVVEQFFRTPDTIYEFMKLVYQGLDDTLKKYRTENKLEDRAIFVLFKGGNVLRMVSNEVFDLLPPEARTLLSEEFVQYFKRSDADFSVYIDPKKLGPLDYDKVLNEVTNRLFAELGRIREVFKRDPDKYFNFMRYSPKFGHQVLEKYFSKYNELKALTTKDSPWYQAKFTQMQLLDYKANDSMLCPYNGQVDTRIESIDGNIVITKLSDKPDWIVNTDNRTLEWSWGSNASKKVKFSLVRSKAYFEYFFEQDGKIKRKAVGGELIDVSIPHRDDDRLREFLDGYDKNVSEYTLIKDADDKFTMKAYSLANLAEDLQFILFDSFDRPWDGGPKYTKRINRIFFLFITEMLGNYGLGAKEMAEYAENVKEFILPPTDVLFPLDKESKELAAKIKRNSAELISRWPKNKWSNDFWHAFANFIEERIVNNPKPGDQENLQGFLEVVEHNLNIAIKLSRMNKMPVDLKKVYQVELDNLF